MLLYTLCCFGTFSSVYYILMRGSSVQAATISKKELGVLYGEVVSARDNLQPFIDYMTTEVAFCLMEASEVTTEGRY